MIKSDFNNLLSSVAQQQQQSVSPQPQPIMKLQHPGAFQSPASNKPTLITPAMFQPTNLVQKVAANAPSQSNARPDPLTQAQLTQALNYMLKTDPDFVRKVHEAYVKSFNQIVSP